MRPGPAAGGRWGAAGRNVLGRRTAPRRPPTAAAARPAGPIVVASVDQVVAAIVEVLSGHLAPAAGLPEPTVVVLSVSDRTLGVGNSRGLAAVGSFAAVELYGGQLDCVVRFQVWGGDATVADAAMTGLQGRLLGARAELFTAGFLQFDGVAGTLPVADRDVWSRTADYHAVVEYHLAPDSAADGLITAIPVETDLEATGSSAAERTTVSGDTVRWDDQSGPTLAVRGRTDVDRLAVAAFLPAPHPSGEVRLVRTHDGATGAPTPYPSLAAFLGALADSAAPERHGQFTFSSLADLVAALDVTGGLLLGDVNQDGVPDGYVVGQLALDPPVRLVATTDRLEISLQTSPLDHVAVVYVRAARTLG